MHHIVTHPTLADRAPTAEELKRGGEGLIADSCLDSREFFPGVGVAEGTVLDDDLLILPGEISKKVLVIGGGIAGIQASLEIADLGYEVVLVEREPCLGGRMAQLSAMYPDLEHPVCLLRELMVRVSNHPRVTVLAKARIDSLDGFAGCFETTIAIRSRRVSQKTCDGCGRCLRACPVKVPSEFDLGIGQRGAIFLPYPQAIPAVPCIDAQTCPRLEQLAPTQAERTRTSPDPSLEGSASREWDAPTLGGNPSISSAPCSACQDVCPRGSIDFDLPDAEFKEQFGAVVLATGLNTVDPSAYPKLGFGRHVDVITSLQLERMLASAGPTKGEVYRCSDGSRPKSVAFVCCVGSRGLGMRRPQCSAICCANVAKQVLLLKRSYSAVEAYVFCEEPVAVGKGIAEMVQQAQEDCGARYIRGRVDQVLAEGGRLCVVAEGAPAGQPGRVEADLVVLAVGLEAYDETVSLAGAVGAMCDENGFVMEAQRQLQPVETTAPGVFVAGSASGPRDIGDTVAQASAVAARVARYMRDLEARGSAGIELDLANADWRRGLV